MGIEIGANGTGAATTRSLEPSTPNTAALDAGTVTAVVTTTGFDSTVARAGAPAADGVTPAEPTPAEALAAAVAVRQPELKSLSQEPETLSAALCVTEAAKLATVEQALQPEQHDAFVLERTKPDFNLDTAFLNVLAASQTPGTHSVQIGSLTGFVEVDARGNVNGEPLASDRELAVAPLLVEFTLEERKGLLTQVGVPSEWMRAATPLQVVHAFNQVEQTRRTLASSNGGAATLSLQTLQTGGGWEGSADSGQMIPFTDVNARVSLTVAANGNVVIDGKPVRAASQDAMNALMARDWSDWPSGTPESHRVSKFSDYLIDESGADYVKGKWLLPVPPAEKLASLADVMDPASAAQLRSLFTSAEAQGNGAMLRGLDEAFTQLMDARASPGTHTLNFSLQPAWTETRSRGLDGETVEVPMGGASAKFSLTVDVAASGAVNGKPLLVDEVARLASEVRTLPPEVKALALRDAGLSEQWVSNASLPQMDYALGRLRAESLHPGLRALDFSWSGQRSGADGQVSTVNCPGKISLDVADDGKVSGHTPLVEVALSTHLAMERISMGEKRQMLAQLGLPQEATREITPAQAAALLTRASIATMTPGEQAFDFRVGSGFWVLGLEVGPKGTIDSCGAVKIPQRAPGREFAECVLTVVSMAFPPAAPVCAAIRAAVAYEQGVRGTALVASVASAIAQGVGVAMPGTQIAATAANLSTAVQVYSAAKSGDYLGLIASTVSLAVGVGNQSGHPVGATFELVGRALDMIRAIQSVGNGDALGGLSTMVSTVRSTVTPTATLSTAGSHQSQVRAVDNLIDGQNVTEPGADYTLPGARLGTGGTSIARLGGDVGSTPVTPTGGVTDIRRIDNATVEPYRLVQGGDTLSSIAAATLGSANRWPELYAYNAERIGTDPNSLREGTVLDLPPNDFSLPNSVRNALFQAASIPPAATVSPTASSTPTNLAFMGDLPFDVGAFLSNSGGDVFGLPPATAPIRNGAVLTPAGQIPGVTGTTPAADDLNLANVVRNLPAMDRTGLGWMFGTAAKLVGDLQDGLNYLFRDPTKAVPALLGSVVENGESAVGRGMYALKEGPSAVLNALVTGLVSPLGDLARELSKDPAEFNPNRAWDAAALTALNIWGVRGSMRGVELPPGITFVETTGGRAGAIPTGTVGTAGSVVGTAGSDVVGTSSPGLSFLGDDRFFPRYASGPADNPTLVRVVVDDGPAIRGRLVAESDASIRVDTGDGVIRDIPTDQIKLYQLNPDVAGTRTFVRGEVAVADANPAYLANARDAATRARADLDRFNSSMTQADFENGHLRPLHETITGAESGRGYDFHRYNSLGTDPYTGAVPGRFRNELGLDPDAQYSASTGSIAPQLEKLKGLGIEPAMRPEILGVPKENFPVQLGSQHFYPTLEAVPAYREAMFNQYARAVEATNPATLAKGPAGVQMEAALDSIADYYHTSINSHAFNRVNQSLFMTDVNALLDRVGLQPVSQGYLDLYAISTNYGDFRTLFKTYVRDQKL